MYRALRTTWRCDVGEVLIRTAQPPLVDFTTAAPPNRPPGSTSPPGAASDFRVIG